MDESVSSANTLVNGSSPMSFNDFYNQYQNDQGYLLKVKDSAGGDLISKFLNGIDNRVDTAKGLYDQYLQGVNRQWEIDKINNARQWEEMMDSTKYQRMAEDLRKAGINPSLVLAQGIGASGQPSSPSGSSNTKYERYEKVARNSNLLSSVAMLLMAFAKL